MQYCGGSSTCCRCDLHSNHCNLTGIFDDEDEDDDDDHDDHDHDDHDDHDHDDHDHDDDDHDHDDDTIHLFLPT